MRGRHVIGQWVRSMAGQWGQQCAGTEGPTSAWARARWVAGCDWARLLGPVDVGPLVLGLFCCWAFGRSKISSNTNFCLGDFEKYPILDTMIIYTPCVLHF